MMQDVSVGFDLTHNCGRSPHSNSVFEIKILDRELHFARRLLKAHSRTLALKVPCRQRALRNLRAFLTFGWHQNLVEASGHSKETSVESVSYTYNNSVSVGCLHVLKSMDCFVSDGGPGLSTKDQDLLRSPLGECVSLKPKITYERRVARRGVW